MTVTEEFDYQETDALVLPHRKLYPAHIPLAHPQLTHFISSPQTNILHYVSGRCVYSLNTSTKERRQILILPFDSRCTASAHGWLCVGGERKGNFAIVRLGLERGTETEVDSVLPQNLGSRRPRSPPSVGAVQAYWRAPLLPRVTVFEAGTDIVNSVSIHKLDGDEKGQPGDVVAVVTNNDMTVRTFSLTKLEQLEVLEFALPMNHATISPDGRLLVAVGDEPYAFYFKRAPADMSLSGNRSQGATPTYKWQPLTRFVLHMPKTAKYNRGYFTSAWSSPGTLCAVASECGFITVFDTSRLPNVPLDTDYVDNDAVVKIIPSTRPDKMPGPGSIRTMCFAPEPWHLLIWTEDEERVCVADIRTGLRTRQILELDPYAKDLEKVELTELGGPYRQAEKSETDAGVDFLSRFERANASNDQAALDRIASEYFQPADPQGLTEDERRIIDGLRTTRQRQEAQDQGATIPHSVNHSPPTFHRMGSRLPSQSSEEDFPALPPGQSQSDFIEHTLPSLSSLRTYMRERYRERSRNDGPPWQPPRRRDSIVLSPDSDSSLSSPADSPADSPAAALAPVTLTASPAHMPHSPQHPPTAQQPPSTSTSTTDPWRAISAAMAASASPSGAGASLPELETRLRRERDRASHYYRQLLDLESLGRRRLALARDRDVAASASDSGASPAPAPPGPVQALRAAGSGSGSGSGAGGGGGTAAESLLRTGIEMGWFAAREQGRRVRTAGVAVGGDGRTLYFGTTEGIFEVGVNVRGRMGFPSVGVR